MSWCKSRAVVIVLFCLVSVVAAQYDYVPEHPRWQSCACEFGTSLGAFALGMAGTYVGVGLAMLPVYLIHMMIINDNGDQSPPSWIFYTGFCAVGACIPAVSGASVHFVGRRMGDERSPWAAVAGAYGGLAVGIGASHPVWPRDENGRLTGPTYWPGNGWPAFAIAAAGTAIGATLGYALSPLRLVDGIPQGSRLGMPSLTMTRSERSDGTAEYGVSLRLVSVRF